MPPKKAPAAAAPVKDTQALPLKEQGLFRQLIRFYETKQYKKGLKTADAILGKFPLNGETLAMKGLLHNCLKNKTEAHALIKKGLAMNIRSSVCWHVYGLLYRSEYAYQDAIKCYQNAIKRDPNNLQILRDLSFLQVQRRMLEGFQETRRQILLLKSGNKGHWLQYAVGLYLCKNYEKALQVLSSFEKSVEGDVKAMEGGAASAYEDSELQLFKALMLEESGQQQKALDLLEEKKAVIVDKLGLRERRARLLSLLGRTKEAEDEYRALIDLNPDGHAHHYGLRSALGLEAKDGVYSAEQVERLTALYKEFKEKYPRAFAPRRMPLDFLSGEAFRAAADPYLRNALRKGIPSLHRSLRPLYKDTEKVRIIEELVLSYIKNLREKNAFSADEAKDTESPSVLLWALYFIGHHYDELKDWERALAAADEAIAHTPTNLDLYVLKARIYKHAGDFATAFKYMDEARKLDTADRYLNTKCTRYAFRADRRKHAEQLVSLFLREGDEDMSVLKDLQVMWYAVHSADCFARNNNWAMALKRYTSVHKFYEDFIEDQFDFHSYCFRKVTLCAYVDLLKWEDNILAHRFYFRSAKSLVKTYLAMHDERQLPALEDAPDLSPEEKRKKQRYSARELEILKQTLQSEIDSAPKEERSLSSAVRKAAFHLPGRSESNIAEKLWRLCTAGGDDWKALCEQFPQVKSEKQLLTELEPKSEKKDRKKAEKKKKDDDDEDQKKDDDPDGQKLAATTDPLGEATKYLRNLQLYRGGDIETHLLGIQVYLRKKKYLLALRAVKQARTLDAKNPETHVGLCQFLLAVEKDAESLNPLVRSVIDSERKSSQLGAGASARELNEAFLKESPRSLAHRLAAARVSVLLDPAGGAAAARELVALRDDDEGTTWQSCLEAVSFLRSLGDEASAEALAAAARIRFPLTPHFRAPSAIAAKEAKEATTATA